MIAARNPHRAWLDAWFHTPDPWRYGRGADTVRHRQALDLLPASTGETLEVGCAEGHFTELLAPRASRLTALELVPAAAARASARTARLAHVRVRRGDATRRLPLRGYDTVVCMDVLYYVPAHTLPAVRARLARRVRPGGLLLLQHELDDIVVAWDAEGGGAECLHPPFLGLGFDVVASDADGTTETLVLRRQAPVRRRADAVADLADVLREPWPAATPGHDAGWAHAELTTGEVDDPAPGSHRRIVLRAHDRPVAEVAGCAPLDVPSLAAEEATLLERHLRGRDRVVGERIIRRSPGASSVMVAVCSTGRRPEVDDLLRELATAFTCHVEENGTDRARLRDLAAELGATYRYERRPGVAAARNRAMAAAGTEWVLLLDDDVVVAPGGAHRLAETLAGCLHDADAATGAVTGLVLPAALHDPAAVRFERYASHRRGDRRIRYTLTSSTDVRWPILGSDRCGVSACVAVRATAWKEVGGFDERLGPGTAARAADDDDFLRALLEGGWAVVYEPSVAVSHLHRATPGALRRQLHGYAVSQSVQLARLAWRRRDLGIARAWARVGRERLQQRRERPLDLWLLELAGHVRGLGVAAATAIRPGRR